MLQGELIVRYHVGYQQLIQRQDFTFQHDLSVHDQMLAVCNQLSQRELQCAEPLHHIRQQRQQVQHLQQHKTEIFRLSPWNIF